MLVNRNLAPLAAVGARERGARERRVSERGASERGARCVAGPVGGRSVGDRGPGASSVAGLLREGVREHGWRGQGVPASRMRGADPTTHQKSSWRVAEVARAGKQGGVAAASDKLHLATFAIWGPEITVPVGPG